MIEMKNRRLKKTIIKAFIVFSIALLVIDSIYRHINNISYLTREKCIVHGLLSKVGFLFFEYLIAFMIIVFFGIFLATLLKKYFSRYQRFYPKNAMTSFLYASLMPVCACAVIPLLKTMKGKLNFRTLITFIVAAPLLSPYIIILSFSVLGVKYAILRIVCSFILAVSSGYLLELFYNKKDKVELDKFKTCDDKSCVTEKADIYLDTYSIFMQILPYLILAGIMGIIFELFVPKNFLSNLHVTDNILGIMIVISIGLPFYFCNGTEVLFLRPLMCWGGFSLGTAMAFSLTSTAICITSMVMLLKFIGKRLTFILLGNIIIVTLVLSYLIDLFFGK